jgi:hypothetical protein
MTDEIMQQALEELRESVEELSDKDLLWLTEWATHRRGGATVPEIAPTGEEMFVSDPPAPVESQTRFWNAVAMVLVAERDRRKG